jgi:hypothetical protein
MITGVTLAECVRMLKRGGVARLDARVLVRGRRMQERTLCAKALPGRQ